MAEPTERFSHISKNNYLWDLRRVNIYSFRGRFHDYFNILLLNRFTTIFFKQGDDEFQRTSNKKEKRANGSFYLLILIKLTMGYRHIMFHVKVWFILTMQDITHPSRGEEIRKEYIYSADLDVIINVF